MQDPIDVYQQAFTCPFCRTKISDVIKLIPDCGRCICDACYDDLKTSIDDESRKYNCKACGQTHILPENEFPDCTTLLDLVRHPIEKPLSEQAKKLKCLIENVQEEMARLEAFNPRDHIEHHCIQLEHEVSQTAQSAVKHIQDIEKELLGQIRTYRQRCLDAATAKLSDSSNRNSQQQASSVSNQVNKDLDTLTKELSEYSAKWDDYFKRLNVLASESELESAVQQADAFQGRMIVLDQEMRNRSLRGTMMQFNPRTSFHSSSDHLGQLVEISTKKKQKTTKMIRLHEQPSRTLPSHTDIVFQVVFLPDGRLASYFDYDSIKVWDVSSGRELFSLPGHSTYVYSLTTLPNGWLASGSEDTTIKLWNLEERKEERTLRGHTGPIFSMKVLSNGNLASYSGDDSIKIWNPYLAANNILLTISGHGNTYTVFGFGVLSNDFLVACSRDNQEEESTMRVWNPIDGKLFKSVGTGVTNRQVWALLVLSNDQVAIGTANGTIKIIDLEDGSKTRTKEEAHDLSVTSLLQLSNDNLVSGGEDESSYSQSIKVWNLPDLTLLQQIDTGHFKGILYLSVSDDETWLATGSLDRTIKLWPVTS